MIRLLSLGGTGDAYLVCALADAVAAQHGSPVVVALRARQSAIPEMFGLPWEPADDEVQHAERDAPAQRSFENYVAPGRTFYAHPCFTNSGVRIDDLTMLPHPISQADMYRALLGLPQDAPLTHPALPRVEARPNTALLIPEAASWPNDHPAFWDNLTTELRAGGWSVEVCEPSSPLADLLRLAAGSEVVVGAQCGVMSIVVAAEFPCRKVICTPSIDDGPGFPVGHQRLRRTYPYAYVTKFTGQDYDVEEYRVTAANHGEIVRAIVEAPRVPRDPRPVFSVSMPLSPGDFLDRLAVLRVKHDNGIPGVRRELDRYVEAWDASGNFLPHAFPRLVDLHAETYGLLDRVVPAALNGSGAPGDHDAAIRLNRERVILKLSIDAALRAPYTEMKGYY